ncbi:MAG: flagellin lysine-N-methylase [Hominimerdicola sp.]
MRLFYPEIFTEFTCIGSNCNDNCCRMGWDIEIDDDTYRFYKSLDDDMGKRLISAITEEDGCHYLMHEGGCPFLNEKGLCSVLLKYGEDKISEICANHPRFFEWFGGYKEAGTGLACEESARLWLCADKIVFSQCEIDEEDDDLEFDEDNLERMLRARTALINLVQNRNFSISQRLKFIVVYAVLAQDAFDFEDFQDFEEFTNLLLTDEEQLFRQLANFPSENSKSKDSVSVDLLNYLQGLDFLGDLLPEMLKSAEKNINEINLKIKDFAEFYPEAERQYENILVYYIFRYFIKGVRSYDIFSKLIFAVISVWTIRILDTDKWLKCRNLGILEQIEIVKEYSKEIDYSFDNTQSIFEDVYTTPALSAQRLIKIL